MCILKLTGTGLAQTFKCLESVITKCSKVKSEKITAKAITYSCVSHNLMLGA